MRRELLHSHLPRCLSDFSCLDDFAALLQLQQTHGTKSRLTDGFLFHFGQFKAKVFFLESPGKLLGILHMQPVLCHATIELCFLESNCI